jgi:uncharacterized protein (TIGR03435 family)
MFIRSWSAALILSWALASGQGSDETARFEVASVKFRPEGREPRHTGYAAPFRNFTGLLTYNDVKLKEVVMRAYNIDRELLVGPQWMDENTYDIMARAPAGTSADQARAMLRNLLAERFKMRVHWESREMASYALVVAKGGPKLTATKTPPPDGQESGRPSFAFGDPVRFEFKAASMDAFARHLSQLIGQHVANMTGLAGYFDVSITVSEDSMPGMGLSTQASDPSSPSIFEAVKTLGLALEPSRAPAQVLIIDSAEKMPTAN